MYIRIYYVSGNWCFFFACEREIEPSQEIIIENHSINLRKDSLNLNLWDLEFLNSIELKVQKYSEEYSISLYDIVEHKSFDEMISEINEFYLCFSKLLENSDIDEILSMQNMRTFSELNEQLYESLQLEDYEKAYETYEQISAIIYCEEDIENAMFKSPESGKIYKIPFEKLNKHAVSIQNSMQALYKAFPVLSNLPSQDLEDAMATSMLISMVHYDRWACNADKLLYAKPPTRQELYNNCVSSAKNEMALTIGAATATYSYSMANCAFAGVPFMIAGCMVIVTGIYASAVYGAKHLYNVTVENCNYRYN